MNPIIQAYAHDYRDMAMSKSELENMLIAFLSELGIDPNEL